MAVVGEDTRPDRARIETSAVLLQTSRLTPETLRQRRQGLGLSLAQLGELLGYPRNTIWRWEVGRTTIAHPELLHLALTALEERKVLNNTVGLLDREHTSKQFVAEILRESLKRFDARDAPVEH